MSRKLDLNPGPDPAEPTAVAQELQDTVAQVMRQAMEHHRSGQLVEAEKLYRALLEVQPEHSDANHNLGIVVAGLRQPKEGLPFLLAALESQPENEQYWLSYVEALLQDKQFEVAEQTLELGRKHGLQGEGVDKLVERLLTIQQKTEQPAVAIDLSMCMEPPAPQKSSGPTRQDLKRFDSLQRKGRLPAIEAFSRELIARFPEHGLGWKGLAAVLKNQGAIDDALAALQKAAELLPDDSKVHTDLATLLKARGHLADAEKYFRMALAIEPDQLQALNDLGNLYRLQKRFPEAEKCFQKALKNGPNAAIYNNLGATLLDSGRIVESESYFRRALTVTPRFSTAYLNLGVSLRKQGRLGQAIEQQRQAVRLDPQNTEHLSNLLFTLNYSTNSAGNFLKEAQQFGRVVAKKVKAPFSSWQCVSEPKRLRVGFVSGDLYNHPVGFFLESLLGRFDYERIELIAYPTNPKEDELTSRIKPFFSAWKPLCGLGDEAAAQQIHADAVHILIDLAGHTSHNRLPMFAWKPAPVQVSWLGYFATTGVTAVDYFLADAVGVPEAQRKNFTETIWYLPDTRLCFSEPAQVVPLAPLPALNNNRVTFGCFQEYTKVGDDVLKVWSAILTALPEARLRWQCKQFGDENVVKQLCKRFEQHGIDPDRVKVHGSMSRAGYLAAHGEVDLILDSFPYPGGTTTCEALWMGVPTLTLAGESLLARQGASLLSAAGLTAWIAETEDDYIAKAIAFSGDLEGLVQLRARLRQQVLDSPLFDAERFARNFEQALSGMWGQRRPQAHLLTPPVDNKGQVNPESEDKPVMNFFNPVFWGTKDPALFTDLMRKAAEQTNAYHFGDNMFLFQRNNSMLNDQPFMHSWENNAITAPDRTIIWRRYILAMAAFHCQHLEGDFVECGAYQGVGAKTVIDYLGGKDFPKTFWLYDMFEHNEKMKNHAMQGHGPQLHAQVIERFKDYPNVKIFKGFLPDVLAEGCPEKIAYLHLDLNQAPAEIATLDALFERVVPGGMIILDDYEMVFYRAQKLAEDTWFAKRGYKVFPLPTSQGFVIKR